MKNKYGYARVILIGIIIIACATTNPANYRKPTPTLIICGQTTDSSLEEHLISLINQKRQQNHLAEWKINPNLMLAARNHSNDMVCNNYYSNNNQTGAGWHEMMIEAGYLVSYGAETTIAGEKDPQKILISLMNNKDASGYSLVLDPIPVEVGVGYANLTGTKYTDYWTIFAAKPSPFQ